MALPQGERQSHRKDLEFRPCPPRRAPHHSRCQRPGSRCTMPPTPAARTPPSWGREITSLLGQPRSKPASGGGLGTPAGGRLSKPPSALSYETIFMLQRTCVTCPVVAGLNGTRQAGRLPIEVFAACPEGRKAWHWRCRLSGGGADSLLSRFNGEGSAQGSGGNSRTERLFFKVPQGHLCPVSR